MSFFDLPDVFGTPKKKPSKKKRKTQTRAKAKKTAPKKAGKRTTAKTMAAKKKASKKTVPTSCATTKTSKVKKSKRGFTGTPGSYPSKIPPELRSAVTIRAKPHCVDPARLVPYSSARGAISRDYAGQRLSETGGPRSTTDPKPRVVDVEPFTHDGKLWVHVGTLSYGAAPYVLWAKAHELLPLKAWRGPVYRHYLDLPRAKRTMLEGGYEGLVVKFKGKDHVLGPEAIFVPLNHPRCP